MRSMSPTEIVTLPAITAPLSSTRLMRSDSPSGPLSTTSPDIRPLPSEVVRRPRAGELDAETTPLVSANEFGHRRAKFIDAIVRDEERRVEHRRACLVGRRLRKGVLRRRNQSRGELIVRERRDLRRNATQLVLPRLIELSPEQISLPRRFRAGRLRFQRGDSRAEGAE